MVISKFAHHALDEKQIMVYLFNPKPHKEVHGRGCTGPIQYVSHLVQERKVSIDVENVFLDCPVAV